MRRLLLLFALPTLALAAEPSAEPPGTAPASVVLTNARVRHLAGHHRHPRAHRTAATRQELVAPRLRAVDGDTFRSGGVRYRLQGIDTPERGQPKYAEAKWRLQELLDSGKVTIERKARDVYGRTVAVVRVDGVDVAQTLRSEGFEKPAAYRKRRHQAWL